MQKSLLNGNVHQFSSVQFSCSVVSDCLRPHESENAKPPCPSPSPGVYSNSRPSSRWCWGILLIHLSHLILCCPLLLLPPIPPSIILFQWVNSLHEVASLGVSALASVLPKNTQDWSPLEWTGWISLQSKGLSRVFSNTTALKHQSSAFSFLHHPNLTFIHDHWKNHSLD